MEIIEAFRKFGEKYDSIDLVSFKILCYEQRAKANSLVCQKIYECDYDGLIRADEAATLLNLLCQLIDKVEI